VIDTLLGVNVKKTKQRLRHIVNAKMIYAEVLRDLGYGCSIIAKSLKMNHATILHYFKVFPGYIASDSLLRNNYERIKSEFDKEYDPIYYLSDNELKKEIISLRIEKELLTSELSNANSALFIIETKENRFKDIFDLIESRTRVGTDEEILSKLNRFYNGVYN
tara:strand:- start:1147 stop:1635 length:489 start_codon:yes stop_codon:yes gene_type:complete